jgi:hypothetical protein
MGAKIQAFDIFQTPLSSHYPLPLTSTLSTVVRDTPTRLHPARSHNMRRKDTLTLHVHTAGGKAPCTSILLVVEGTPRVQIAGGRQEYTTL